jgi:hypothetical protein
MYYSILKYHLGKYAFLLWKNKFQIITNLPSNENMATNKPVQTCASKETTDGSDCKKK